MATSHNWAPLIHCCRNSNPYRLKGPHCSGFHFLFHHPNITPKDYSSCHFLFHYPNIIPIFPLYFPKEQQHYCETSRCCSKGHMLRSIAKFSSLTEYVKALVCTNLNVFELTAQNKTLLSTANVRLQKIHQRFPSPAQW